MKNEHLAVYSNYRQGRTAALVEILQVISDHEPETVQEVKQYLIQAIRIAEARGMSSLGDGSWVS